MSGTAALQQTALVKLDGSGNGVIGIGPTGYKESWTNVTAAVHCSTNVLEAQCRIFVGAAASANYFVDGTYAGSTGDSTTNLPPTVVVGQLVWAQWSAGDANATAYLTLTGTRNVA